MNPTVYPTTSGRLCWRLVKVAPPLVPMPTAASDPGHVGELAEDDGGQGTGIRISTVPPGKPQQRLVTQVGLG